MKHAIVYKDTQDQVEGTELFDDMDSAATFLEDADKPENFDIVDVDEEGGDPIIDMFRLGMKRDIAPLLASGDTAINLGAGKQHIAGAINLDLPEWNAEVQTIPCGDASVDTIYAFHFLEHLPASRVIFMLREFERVLKVDGTANIVVPHRLSQMAWHDLDHKTVFCEETWRTLFSTPYYDKNREVPWKLRIGTNIIIGVVERNLALLTQLVRTE